MAGGGRVLGRLAVRDDDQLRYGKCDAHARRTEGVGIALSCVIPEIRVGPVVVYQWTIWICTKSKLKN